MASSALAGEMEASRLIQSMMTARDLSMMSVRFMNGALMSSPVIHSVETRSSDEPAAERRV